MEWFLFGTFIFITAIVLPWVNLNRHNKIRTEVRQLQEIIARLGSKTVVVAPPEKRDLIDQATATEVLDDKKKQVAKEEGKRKDAAQKEKEWEENIRQRIAAQAASTARYKAEIVQPKKEKLSFEQQFGARLPVWIGGIALVLAGFFLVKYSIDNSLLSQDVRVILGCISGAVLLYTADWIRKKPNFANGVRISQSLSGAGIATLYVSLFAATSLYELVDPIIGFAGMALVTATAVYLSLKHGAPIALLGLVGGFLTPALIGSASPSAPLLFIYLYFVFTGLMFVIRKENWWWLSFPSIIGSCLWVIYWLTSAHFNPGDAIWLGLFLLATSATIVITSKQKFEEDRADATDAFKFGSALNYVGIGGSLILMAVIAGEAGFGVLEWCLFGLLSLGGIGLAFYNEKLYGFVPLASMVINAIMLMAWGNVGDSELAITIAAFAALFMASGYYLLWRAKTPLVWAFLSAGTALGYFLLGYFKIGSLDFVVDIEHQWGILALGFAVASVYATDRVAQFYAKHEYREYLLAIFAVAATSFISIALTIELDKEFLSVAFAMQVLAIALINTKVSIKALRYISMVLALIFGFLLIPQILLLVQLTAYSLVEAKLHLQDSIPLVKWPVFQLGLPAVMFIGASYLLRKQDDDRLVRYLELAAIALIGVMGYYFTRNAFHVDENVLFVKAGFFERGIISNVLFVYGLACFAIGRLCSREMFSLSGVVLCGVAIFRIVYFDMVIYNPVWNHQDVGVMPIINSLLIPFGLPIIWSFIASKELAALDRAKLLKYTNIFTLALLFTLISMNVRQLFQGAYLDSNIATNAEVYSYSAAWLLLGVGLLFAGTIRKDIMLRYASLAIMLLTVGKVFLYDASELDGLFRVFSFLGLGASLMGLSWFYTRFVFGLKVEDKPSVS